MDFPSWLDADRGRLTSVAEHFGLTQSAVSQWRQNGVPPGRMKAVRELTGGAVTLDDMLPDADRPHPQGRPALDVAAPKHAATAV
ncbi:MAG TPA: YdaS family helix-turn-helix protein [Ottowia sp.]|nr:YdaS family helix-turn-helix protein [Thauera aminoaromatica]HON29412.1 YdaS family helix-turn-helix protein [Ottowia sp.]